MKVAALALLAVAAAGAPRTPKVAVIAALSGDVSVERGTRAPARVREWLCAGDGVSAGEGARLVVVYRSGRRFEVRGPARVKVHADVLARGSGVTELERLPAWPPDVEPDEVRGGRSAGTRVRSGTIEGLVPGDGDVVLADGVRLRFRPEPLASEYSIEVRDARGQLAFQTRTSTPDVPVPAHRLRPGREYVWGIEAVGTDASGEASFRTLDDRAAAARARIRAEAERLDGGDVLPYLEALDLALGLATTAAP